MILIIPVISFYLQNVEQVCLSASIGPLESVSDAIDEKKVTVESVSDAIDEKKAPVETVSNAIDEKKAPMEASASNTTVAKKESSEELTLADVDKMKQDLMKTISENEAEKIASVFRKFTKDTTDEEKFEGLVSFTWARLVECNVLILSVFIIVNQIELLVLGIAAGKNGTATDILKVISDSSEEKSAKTLTTLLK